MQSPECAARRGWRPRELQMTRRVGVLPAVLVTPLVRLCGGPLRRAGVIGGLVGVCCLFGAPGALATAAPKFGPGAESPFTAGVRPPREAFTRARRHQSSPPKGSTGSAGSTGAKGS